MNYDKNALVLDFARRTKKNLEFVESCVQSQHPKSDVQVFEVTQLINSLLGLLVFPQQKFYNEIPTTPLSELKGSGWPEIKVIDGKLREESVKGLLRYLRNSVSHFNIEFKANENGAIIGIVVWNIPPRSNIHDWKAELGLKELKLLIYKFIELIETMTATRQL